MLWVLTCSVCPGLLGAAPTIPLLANPALSAALFQMLLQNQAKAQQVPLPFHPFTEKCPLVTQPVFDPASPAHTRFLLTLLSALSPLTISKPFWEITFCGLKYCTIKRTPLCLV